MSHTTNASTATSVGDLAKFSLGLGLVGLYATVVIFLTVPSQWPVVRSGLVGLAVAVTLGALAFGLYRLIRELPKSAVLRWVGTIAALVVLALVIGYRSALLFSHWSSTIVFDQFGNTLGYAPSPAEGGFDGANYTPLETPQQDAPAVPDN